MENETKEIKELINKHKRLQTLMYLVNKETLLMEHKRQKVNKASGVDKMTKEKYSTKKEENIEELLRKMKGFSYKPQPVRRVYIPKVGSDKLRPLGIPAYEDKLVQGVMANILNEIYEQKFYGFSYGFRPNKNCHQAIKEVNKIIIEKKINYIVDADIKGFFDNVDQKWLMKFLEHDIQDKNFLRYIVRFLKAGIMEEGEIQESEKGTPQGGLISPILANIYLHYVLDMWFEKVVKKQCKGESYLVRYADDFVAMFQYEWEAKSYYKELKERLAKFKLEIAEDKSKIIKFGRFSNNKETFDFLGFIHMNGANSKGTYAVVHKTSKKKLKDKKQVAKKWIKENMHEPIEKIIKKLNKKLIGHYAYYGITGNYSKIKEFYKYIIDRLFRYLKRRGQRKKITWYKFNGILKKTPVINPRLYVCLYN